MKNLTAKPFKNGDRVVFAKIVIDAFKAERLSRDVIAKSAPLNDLTIKEDGVYWMVTGEGVDYLVGQDGTGSLGDNPRVQVILHAPAFGHLKAGDPCPFVVGQVVEKEGGIKGNVTSAQRGPIVGVLWSDADGKTLYSGWDNVGHKYTSLDINTIFPITQEQPAHAAGFEFGDKVKSDNGNSWWVVGSHSTLVFIVPGEQDLECIRRGVEDEDSMLRLDIIHSSRLTPWIEPVTVKLNHEYEATVYPEHIKVGCQEFPLSIIDELVEARKKVTDHE